MTVYNPSPSGGGGTPGGSSTDVQFNDSGTFGGNSGFTYDKSSKRAGIQSPSPESALEVQSDTGQSPNPVASFSAILTAETFPANVSSSAAIAYQPSDSSTAAPSAAQTDFSGSYLADGSTSLDLYIYAYSLIAGSRYYFGSPSVVSFSDNSDGNNFYIAYAWTGITGADGYVLQSSGSANNGNPNWSEDVGNVTSWNDDGTNSSSDPIPLAFSVLNPYIPVTAPDDSANANPVSVSQSDFSGIYLADGSTSFAYSVYGVKVVGSSYEYVGIPAGSGTFNDNSDGSSFGIFVSWNTVSNVDGYLIYKNGYNDNTGSLSGYLFVGNSLSHTDDGSAWTDPGPVIFSAGGITRYYEAGSQSVSPVGTTVFDFGASYSVTDSYTVPYVIVHSVTLNGNAGYALIGDPNGGDTAYYHEDSATTLVEGSSGFWTLGTLPSHYGFQSNGSILNRYYADYGIQGVVYSPTGLTSVTTDPGNGLYYYVSISQALGSGNTDSKILRGIGSASYSAGRLTAGASTLYDYAGAPFTDGTAVTPNSVYPAAGIFSGHGSSTADAAVLVSRSLDGSYSRLEFQDMSKAALGYLESSSDGLSVSSQGGTSRLSLGSGGFDFTGNPAYFDVPGFFRPQSDSSGGLVIVQHSAGQTGSLLQIDDHFGTFLAGFDGKATLRLVAGSSVAAPMIMAGGSGTVSTAGAFQWTSTDLMPSFNDGSGANHLFAALNVVQSFAAKQSFAAGISVGNSFMQPNIHLQTQNLGTTVEGDLIYAGGQYYLSDSNQYRQVARLNGNTGLTINCFVRANSSGFLINDNALIIVSGVIVAANLLLEAKQGISVDSGQSLSMGNGSPIIMGQGSDMQTNSSSGTRIASASTQKIGFWGTTPVVQPANTAAIDTFLSTIGLRASGGVANFDNDIKASVVGKGLYIKEGTNATMGIATLSAGTVTVPTTKVTANSRIFLTIDGGTLTNVGATYVSARTAGTSFTISSTNILDASSVSWIIIEPA